MKKTLVALAALSVVGLASAQVTITGAVDISYGKLAGGEFGINNGMNYISLPQTQREGGTFLNGYDKNVNASFIAIKGTEDLGGGMSAGFNLTTAGMDMSHGATSINFSRESFVSLSSKGLGTLQVGRQTAPTASIGGAYDLTFGNASGYQGISGGAFRASSRRSNQAQFISDPVMDGLVIRAGLQMQGDQNEDVSFASNSGTPYTATSTADGTLSTVASYKHVVTLGGNYNAGPLSIGAGFETASSNCKTSREAIILGGSYDLGMAKIAVMWAQNDSIGGASSPNCIGGTGGTANQAGKTLFNNWQSGARFGAGATISASMPLGATTLAAAYSSNSEQGTTGYEVIAKYALSKSTNLYASYFGFGGTLAVAALSSNQPGGTIAAGTGTSATTGGATLGAAAIPADPTSLNFGVRMTF